MRSYMENSSSIPNTDETVADILNEIRDCESPHMLKYCDRIEAAIEREKRGAKLLRFDLGHSVEDVLRIGRDFQNTDRLHGAHYDTVKLLCDTIEELNEQLLEQKNLHPLESQP